MTDDLRAAAERHLYEIVIGPIDDAMDEFKASDRKEWLEESGWQNVSIRWIDTEHPADDDEPVTVERLALAGFVGPCEVNANILEHPTGVIAVTNGTDWTVRVCFGGTRLHNPKWWQVSDLIRVLKGGERDGGV